MSMKIAIVAAEFPPAVGGMEQHAYGLASTLAREHEVIVYTSAQHMRHSYSMNFTVRPVLSLDIRRDAMCLKEEEVDFWLVLNAGYSLLARMLDAPVFIYCHGNDFLKPWITEFGKFESMLLAAVSRMPLLWRRVRSLRSYLDRKAIGAGLEAAPLVFANSEYTKRQLSLAFPRLQVPVLISPPGICEHFFSKPVKGNNPRSASSTLRLLTVARLSCRTPEKNIDKLLCALALLKDDIPFSMTIAGDGDLKATLEALASSLGVNDRVTFVGNVDNAEVPSLLDSTDLFILPSKESFGMVYAEAAARGVPVIASRQGGAADALREGITGIVIEDSEPETIASAVRLFANTQSDFDRRAIEDFAQHFRWSEIASNLISATDSLSVSAHGKFQCPVSNRLPIR